MTHLRKLTAVLLAVIMVFALAACGEAPAPAELPEPVSAATPAPRRTTPPTSTRT